VAHNLEADMLALYGLAQLDAEFARRAWSDAGMPLQLDSGHGGVHPLRKALVEADDRVGRRARDVVALARAKHARRGRPVGAASAPDRVTLRSVT
jgi:hypothetical protein